MKQILAYIFLFIFSFQVLPVKELGKLLFKGQMTEEIHEYTVTDDAPGSKLKKEGDPLHLNGGHAYDARIKGTTALVITALHMAERLPKHHVVDIFTPPPNA